MRYYVLAANGTKYGPADIPTLNQWIEQKRLTATMTLEEEGTGKRVPATSLRDLVFPFASQVTPNASAQPDRGVPKAKTGAPDFVLPTATYREPEKKSASAPVLAVIAWVLGVVGLLLHPEVFATAGIVFAAFARTRGQRSATAAIVFCCAALVVGLVFSATIHSLLHR